MLVSYKWLQTYFDTPLPSPSDVAEKLIFGAFEIESTESKGDDTIFDVKILPNRAHDCLSHRGIARELSTLLDIPLAHDPLRDPVPVFEGGIEMHVEDFSRAPVGAAAYMTGVKIGPSPDWLKERLESIGQRSINNVVDATNYIMYDLGMPTHAFGAEVFKKDGAVHYGIRASRKGEKITLLGGTEIELTGEEAVIMSADRSAVDLGGVKGGAVAELKPETSEILVSASKFDPVRTRRAAQRFNVRTDASKRFENEMADDMPLFGLQAVVKLIIKTAGGKLEGAAIVREIQSSSVYKLGISAPDANRLLGSQLQNDDLDKIFTRLNFNHERVSPTDTFLRCVESAVGKPYKRGARIRYDSGTAFDCSALTAWAAIEAGYSGMPRIAIDQFAYTDPVEEKELRAGDLVFTNTGLIISVTGSHYSWVLGKDVKEEAIRTKTVEFMPGTDIGHGVDHVGIYMGNGEIIHASSSGVVREKLVESAAFKKEKWLRRIIVDETSRFVIPVPFERLDLRIKEDLIEEIGRVYGYDKIGSEPFARDVPVETNKSYYYSEAVRAALTEEGFTEVYTYTLIADGKVQLANPLAADKGTLRANLSEGVREAFLKNEKNLPLLGTDAVCIFEIGAVFPSAEREEMHVCLGGAAADTKRTQEILEKTLGTKINFTQGENTLEFNLSDVIVQLPVPKDSYPKAQHVDARANFTPLSLYPFVLRDIALWVSSGTTANDVLSEIKKQAGELLVHSELFDEFKKGEQISYAFHLVFQSFEKTLTDEEVNNIMEKVNAAALSHAWKVR